MRTLFSTAAVDPRSSFRHWRETIFERIVPLEQTKLDDGAFSGSIEAADIGGLSITRVSTSAVRSELTPTAIRRLREGDTVAIGIKLIGVTAVTQDGREAVQRTGDITVLDRRPLVVTSGANSQGLTIELPRKRLEQMLGSTRLYSALNIEASRATASLATAFFAELIRVHEALAPGTAERLASIGIDLIIASIADRLARDVPRPLHGTIIIQRAKAYVEANLGDPTLDPPRLAAAVGVSLRRLQELFHERGRHISDWIWGRRLEVAAERLIEPASAYKPIGSVAYACGFANQAHFARRFKDRFGMTPTEFRRQRLYLLFDR